MKRDVKVRILFFIILSIVLLSACTKKDVEKEIETTTKEKIVLNERQIKILEEAELPTVYDELPLSQKSAIESIEDFLVYLEDKYGETFCYDGYVPDGFGEREHIIAYAESDSRKRTVTAYRDYENGKFIYEDDYQNVLAEEDYKNALKAFINQYLDEKDYKLIIHISHVDDGWTKDTILEKVGAAKYVFINQNTDKKQDYMDFIKKYGEWMKENRNKRYYCTQINFLVQSEKDFQEINDDNYLGQINGRKYEQYICCTICDGELEIERVN